jgi:hypothetical protein
MKRLLVLLLFLVALVPYNLFAQVKVSSYASTGFKKIHVFGSTFAEMGALDNYPSLMIGAGGGVIIKNWITIGGYWQSFTHERFWKDNTALEAQTTVKFSHGGVWLGFSPMERFIVHPLFSTRVGYGQVMWRREWWAEAQKNPTTNKTDVLVIQPMAGVEVNCTKWLRVSLEFGARVVSSYVKLPEFNFDKMNSNVGMLTFKFGRFY